MAKKLLMIDVRGKRKGWSFHFYGDPKYIAEWRADGLVVHEVDNVIPVWVVELGLTRPWCFFQDIINLRNPFQ